MYVEVVMAQIYCIMDEYVPRYGTYKEVIGQAKIPRQC